MLRFCVIALNPAIDAEWRVEDVLWEEKNVIHSQRRWPGGKGVNVARWLTKISFRNAPAFLREASSASSW